MLPGALYLMQPEDTLAGRLPNFSQSQLPVVIPDAVGEFLLVAT